jgi:hypothetical protein
MTIEQTQIAKPEELDYNLAYQAYRNVSFDADNRAKDEQERFAFSVNSIYAEMSKAHNNPAQIEYLDKFIQEYKNNYLAKRRAYLHALSSVASVMIAGPSNFNTSRNQKRSNAADNRLQELSPGMSKPENPFSLNSSNCGMTPKKFRLTGKS